MNSTHVRELASPASPAIMLMIDATSTAKICAYHNSYSVHHQSLKAMKQGLVYMATDDNLASGKATGNV